jgi:hypothetical protein
MITRFFNGAAGLLRGAIEPARNPIRPRGFDPANALPVSFHPVPLRGPAEPRLLGSVRATFNSRNGCQRYGST